MNIKELESFLSRHNFVALQFSAGKDSLACLKLLQPYLEQIVVLWCNAGNPYPETVEYMDEIYAKVPHFIEVTGNQPAWVIEHGMPVDVMPVSLSHFGPMMHDRIVPKFQPFNQCCAANLWEPMADWIMKNGVTGLIRGQKNCDVHKPPFRSGDWVGEIEFFHPIEDWTDEQVFEFLGDEVPLSYKRGLTSSLDCMNCTAYADTNKARLEDLDYIYPPAAAQIRSVHSFLKEELIQYLKTLGA